MVGLYREEQLKEGQPSFWAREAYGRPRVMPARRVPIIGRD